MRIVRSSRRSIAICHLTARIRNLGFALRSFLHGFVGQTALPCDPAAARHALSHHASGRGRCC